ncbi:hypothetical protein M1D97_05220 [Kushneria sp. AK178]
MRSHLLMRPGATWVTDRFAAIEPRDRVRIDSRKLADRLDRRCFDRRN